MCIVSDQHGNDFICLNLMTCCTKNENCTALLSAALNFLRTCPTWAQTQMVSLHLPNSFQHAAKPFKSSEPGKCCLSDLWRLWQGLLDSHENRAISSEFRAENRARIEQARLRIEQESSEFKTKAENRGESSKVSRRFRGESSESSGFEPEPAQPNPGHPLGATKGNQAERMKIQGIFRFQLHLKEIACPHCNAQRRLQANARIFHQTWSLHWLAKSLAAETRHRPQVALEVFLLSKAVAPELGFTPHDGTYPTQDSSTRREA